VRPNPALKREKGCIGDFLEEWKVKYGKQLSRVETAVDVWRAEFVIYMVNGLGNLDVAIGVVKMEKEGGPRPGKESARKKVRGIFCMK